MTRIRFSEVVKAVQGLTDWEGEDFDLLGVSTDSRKTEATSLYIALKGTHYDGHAYVLQAFENGAVAAIVETEHHALVHKPIIRVEDTLKALWDLAAYYRMKLAKPVIGITGSVGKTSTKDMIGTLLREQFNVHQSEGNHNNEIGLPITLLEMDSMADMAVVEMGMRGLGEIRSLTRIARPDIALITNIGLSHIERLKSKENILRAKMEIVEGLHPDGVLILNANDPLLKTVNPYKAKKVIYVGVDTEADYRAYDVVDYGEEGTSFKVRLDGRVYEMRLTVIGTHHVTNALFGIACAHHFGMSPEAIAKGLKKYKQEKMRLNLVEKGGILFINDSYNSSPDSVRAALAVLNSLAKDTRSYAILGSMFELGEMAEEAHYEVGCMCKHYGIHFTALLGENAEDVAKGIGEQKHYQIFNSHEDIVRHMKETLRPGDVVLIKGSRGMFMERVLEMWEWSSS